MPREGPFAGRVAIRVPKPRPGDFLRNAAQTIPNDRFSVFGALISRRARAIGEQQDKNGADEKATGDHSGALVQFEPAPFNAFRKYSIVFLIPSSNWTFGSQPRIFFAREMSGCRTFGSSTGNGL